MTLLSFFLFFFFACVRVFSTNINIDSTKTGRILDGIGAISGGGATSKLLVNYDSAIQNELLDYLFKPGYGASLHMLKVEMGGDAQTTEGTEGSHMHDPWDENYFRGYEWWLMKEAKKRNPDILLLGLPWAFPYWIGMGTSSPWTQPAVTATYVTKWILGAKKFHNLTIDYMGIWNEKPYNLTYVKVLRSMLNQNGLHNVKLVVGDGTWQPGEDISKDHEFASAFDVIGVHYPGTVSTSAAKASGKALWSSEDYSTISDSVGAACWARVINQNYVKGLMTSTIAWNLVTSYYDSLPFPRTSLLTANQPWSGHYEIPGPLWVTAHTTHFTKPGWIYLAHGSGVGLLQSGGSIVSLMSPDRKQLTIVIETMAYNHSKCVRPPTAPYAVTEQTVSINLSHFEVSATSLRVFVSNVTDKGSGKYFQRLPDLLIQSQPFRLTLSPNSLVTLTTLSAPKRKAPRPSPPPASFPLPYKDNFEQYAINSEPFYITPQAGYFEVLPNPLRPGEKCVAQVVRQSPIHWCPFVNSAPVAVMGPGKWSTIKAEVSVMLPSVNGSSSVFVATRLDQGGCNTWMAQGIFLWLVHDEARLVVSADLMRSQTLFSQPMAVLLDHFYQLQIDDKGTSADIIVNGRKITTVTPSARIPKQGFVAIGSGNFGKAFYDDLFVFKSDMDNTLKFKTFSKHTINDKL